MLNINFIRHNRDKIEQNIKNRNSDLDISDFYKYESDRKNIQVKLEEYQAKRNSISKEIGLRKRNNEDAEDLFKEVKNIKDEIETLKNEFDSISDKQKLIIDFIPNMLLEDVPIGKDETANKVLYTKFDKPEFDFDAKPHWELAESLGIIDFEAAAKITGSRFAVMLGAGAKLERSLINFFIDEAVEKNYIEMIPPYLVNETSMFGTGQLPKFDDDSFKTKSDEYFLVPTAEVPVTNYYRDQIIESDLLPVKFAAFTPCFRREAGSYGKDVRGLIRQHQFHKVELLKFVKPETAEPEFESLTDDAEELLHKLQLPYRKVILSSGDTGFSSAKTYDLEVYLPYFDDYKEVSSCSLFTDFQARRANIRYRDKNGKPQYVYTINGSGLAVGRTLLAILENYQNADGSINVPEVLKPYMKCRILTSDMS